MAGKPFNSGLAGLKTLKSELKKSEEAQKVASRKKRQIESRTRAPDPSPLSDSELFEASMRGVETIEQRKTRIEPPKRKRSELPDDDADVLSEMQKLVSGGGEFRISDTGEFQYGLAPGVSMRVLDKLKKGAFSYRLHLDLHGHTQTEAKDALIKFIKEAYLKGERCILVVTGRGMHSDGGIGVLRQALPRWLSRAPLASKTLAYCTAKQVDGGLGAYYILLRK